jgi:molybdenum cofactor synthesis domain-containing protein
MRAAILTLSDKGSRGERVDESGPALAAWLAERGVRTVHAHVIADEFDQIVQVLTDWADRDIADLILTTGGTGVSPRDVTPEATTQICSRMIPGLGELMRIKSLEITPMAALSRAVAGIRNQSLIINLPGSPKGAVENLGAIWSTLGHAVEKIRGGQDDCGGKFHHNLHLKHS